MKMRYSLGNVHARRLKMGGAILAVAAAQAVSTKTLAAPYASNVVLTNGGTDVSFILNEPADALSVVVNGGAPQILNGATAGTKTFTLPSAGSTFSITATKFDSVGYTIPTGGSGAAVTNGLSVATALGGTRLISSDSNNLNKFSSPRGVGVSTSPNATNFGTAYIANSQVATTGRIVGDGLYAVRADQTDAFGYGDAAQAGGLNFTLSANSPFRIHAAADGFVYISDFSDASGSVSRMSTNLSTGQLVLAGIGGPATVPAGQNHGSTTSVYAEGSPGALTLYTIDEDLTTNSATGSGSTADKNSVWKYSIGGAALPYSGAPTKVNVANVLTPAATSDLDRGADGKFYLAQTRSAGGEPGIVVLSADGATLFDSLSASRTLLGNAAAPDIFRQVNGVAVSPDQRWLAVVLNNSDLAVVPLINGIPDIANRLLIDTGTDINSGRDIAFDAAGNIHYVSSGQALYRVLSPGGNTTTTLSFDGASYSFVNAVPEPATLGLLGMAVLPMLRRRRR